MYAASFRVQMANSSKKNAKKWIIILIMQKKECDKFTPSSFSSFKLRSSKWKLHCVPWWLNSTNRGYGNLKFFGNIVWRVSKRAKMYTAICVFLNTKIGYESQGLANCEWNLWIWKQLLPWIPPPPKKKPSHPQPQSTPLTGLSTTAARDTRGTAKRNN